ncbi:hypothetical protein DUNSADRAFT_1386 [Dunaliella salina]|uniref:Encoded protein n=1 Tax=Dunaliella salina TaxID=3046 RepID=A0ABQ7FXJ5_DUNSA|nr:hypothetical protein DUNSADRAFT_1386 [Dunaliella salina]|eukprot:KAF5827066.1 hypothetical protein DUNSADRAFT_1386 [Dunaliella salina]
MAPANTNPLSGHHQPPLWSPSPPRSGHHHQPPPSGHHQHPRLPFWPPPLTTTPVLATTINHNPRSGHHQQHTPGSGSSNLPTHKGLQLTKPTNPQGAPAHQTHQGTALKTFCHQAVLAQPGSKPPPPSDIPFTTPGLQTAISFSALTALIWVLEFGGGRQRQQWSAAAKFSGSFGQLACFCACMSAYLLCASL